MKKILLIIIAAMAAMAAAAQMPAQSDGAKARLPGVWRGFL